MLGAKFDEALALASELHREQKRKDSETPYLAHLMAVAGIVLEANSYHQFENIEDIAVAALLHDAVEDQGHKITLEEIRARFGDTVHDIVRDCSDAVIQEKGEQIAPSMERKKAYIERIRGKRKESILVSCADKMHNARSMLFDHGKMGDKLWDRFNTTKQELLWYYESLEDAFRETWPENPLLDDFEAMVERFRKAVRSG